MFIYEFYSLIDSQLLYVIWYVSFLIIRVDSLTDLSYQDFNNLCSEVHYAYSSGEKGIVFA